ncbi:Branched-chain amino acid transport protein AzlD [Granulicatella balaenopterae]|uniref:Branched-chain amino acid transport protein AzlD n=1 Tax=Granulicatella balaenopterae TaxID=137733 RepID=A0A1H9MPE1_9LACT|nr:AzlD domain-containing protein [Granulicatella balaenopterae]SER25003.1 Branched-chain amino acid transport protein AzlD [Granulicatella balaenopterae]
MFYLYLGTLVAAVTTFIIRLFPYIALSNKKELPLFIQYLSVQLPRAIMVILVVYCVKHISFMKTPYGLPEIACIIFVAVLHKWKHNTLLSIFVPTVIYMVLIQNFS